MQFRQLILCTRFLLKVPQLYTRQKKKKQLTCAYVYRVTDIVNAWVNRRRRRGALASFIQSCLPPGQPPPAGLLLCAPPFLRALRHVPRPCLTPLLPLCNAASSLLFCPDRPSVSRRHFPLQNVYINVCVCLVSSPFHPLTDRTIANFVVLFIPPPLAPHLRP